MSNVPVTKPLPPSAEGCVLDADPNHDGAPGRTPGRGLPPPPTLSPAMGRVSEASRTAFRLGNRSLMVPLHRAGLAAWLGNPLTGWQLLLTTTGRKSGLERPTPLGYLVAEGAAWVLAGYGPATLWYRNLLAEPRVEVLLPARPSFAARAEEVLDPEVRARIIPALCRSMAVPGALIGAKPASASDEKIMELTAWVPLIALRPEVGRLVAGPDDPGGLGWIPRQVVATVAAAWLLRVVGRLVRRLAG